MPSAPRVRVRQLGSAFEVAASQIALALANYAVLALSGRALSASGFAVLSAFFLLVNTAGRGVFAAVELELTRSIADARARGVHETVVRSTALRHTGLLAGVAALALAAAGPLLWQTLGNQLSVVALLAVGMASIAFSYWVRGPLAAARRYHRYTATFGIEAVVGLAGAAALAVTGVAAVPAWVAVFALAPLASLFVAAFSVRGDGQHAVNAMAADGTANMTSPGQFGWSTMLLFTSQALWNLGPVIVVYRLPEAPMIAAGFAAFAVILRVPILLFPALQAILLPPVTARFSRGDRSGVARVLGWLGVWLGVLGVGWMAAALLLAEPVVELVFSAIGAVPPTAVIAALALSALLGAMAQLLQIGLVAQQRQRTVALCWVAGLTVFVMTAFAPFDPVIAAAVGQLAGAVCAVVLLGIALHRGMGSRRA